jgi:serine/threonine protein kinase
MSPILYKALKTEPSKGVNHNVFKSDVFSLGMCFLLASCLDYKCLYDMRKVKNMIDVKNLVKKYVDNKYSYNFVDILTRMLNLYEKDRPDFIELRSMV